MRKLSLTFLDDRQQRCQRTRHVDRLSFTFDLLDVIGRMAMANDLSPNIVEIGVRCQTSQLIGIDADVTCDERNARLARQVTDRHTIYIETIEANEPTRRQLNHRLTFASLVFRSFVSVRLQSIVTRRTGPTRQSSRSLCSRTVDERLQRHLFESDQRRTCRCQSAATRECLARSPCQMFVDRENSTAGRDDGRRRVTRHQH
jgi:hypothetical protein